LDLKAQYRNIKPEIDQAVARVLDSCQFVLDPEVAEFERKFRHPSTARSRHATGAVFLSCY
jgi:dTDP-4-amino-4,6-dideoxygalactose transaminase